MIFVLWPTCRPQVAITRATQWLERASDKTSMQFMFGVNTDEHLALLMAMPNPLRERSVWFLYPDCRPGATATATKLTRMLVQDFGASLDRSIVVLASDDFESPQNWDSHLLSEALPYTKEHPELRTMVALIVNDGYKKDTNIIPLPVVSGPCLKRLNGIIYHPNFRHFFSDEELFYVATELGLIRNLRGTDAPVFHHRHWSFSGRDRDQFDERNNTHWTEDKATYDLRKDWPVEKKLELPEGWK